MMTIRLNPADLSTTRSDLGLVIGTDVLAPNGSGANLTALNATNLASGTVPTARLGSGTASSSTFLRGDSTYATIASSGWEHVETKTGDNAAMTFSHTVESGYDYQFVFRNCNMGGDHSTDTYIPHLQVGTGAGPTFQTSGYLNQTLMTDSTTVTAERNGLTKGVSIHGNMGTIGGDGDNEYMSGQTTIFDPGAATKTVAQGRMFIDDGSSVPHMNLVSGRYDTAVAVTAFRFTSDVFQFESGTVALYRKAIA